MVIDMVGVDVDPSKIICQKIVPWPGGCGPATFLNALRFGPEAFQGAFTALSGNSDQEKLANIITAHGSAPSAAIPGRSLFGSNGGVWEDDVQKYFGSVFAGCNEELKWTYFDIAGKEAPAEHLHRVHALLISSLEQGVPVIASLHAFAARKKKDEKFAWRKIAGHFVLIVQVSKKISSGAKGFVFQFADSGVGQLCEGYIYSETVRGFLASKESCAGYIYNEIDKGFEPLKGSHQTNWIENGFLNVTSPSLSLKTREEPWHARTFLTLDFGFGKFTFEPVPTI